VAVSLAPRPPCPVRVARTYEHWDEMLAAKTLDAVWVCTPPLELAEPTIAALERGVHVYLERPIARTQPNAERIVAAAACSEAICVVRYQSRALEFLDHARSALAHRPVAMPVARNYGPVAPSTWFLDRWQGGGQILSRCRWPATMRSTSAGLSRSGRHRRRARR
jgi:myo-inositol 2-dehydrogenase / D-chiro-inositol 1-dehydrogenase